MSVSNKMRNIIRKSLSSNFTVSESKQIESKIFAMCEVLYSHLQKHNTPEKEKYINLEDFYKKVSYDKVGELILNSGVHDITNNITKDISNNTIGWKSCIYISYRENEKRDTEDQTENMKVMKGEIKCRVKTCRSDQCLYYTMQTRGCDEGGTTFVICTKCREIFTLVA